MDQLKSNTKQQDIDKSDYKKIIADLQSYTLKKIRYQWSVTLNSSSTKADLASLRRNILKSPARTIEPWAIIFGGNNEEIEQLLKGKLYTNSRHFTGLSQTEVAIYYAFSLYAIHQQSISDKSMDSAETSPGYAFAKLSQVRGSKNDSALEEAKKVMDKLKSLAGKKDFKMQMADLYGLFSLLNDAEIPLDYAQLVVDLFNLQSKHYKDQVLIRWINDFNRFKYQAQTPKEDK